MKWSEMSERERDALVAEKVFEFPNVRKFHSRYVYDNVGSGGFIAGMVDIPHYAHNLADAWQVVEKLKQTEYGVQIYCQNGFEWSVTLYEAGAHGAIETFDEPIQAPTAPETICIAALIACGVEIEQ